MSRGSALSNRLVTKTTSIVLDFNQAERQHDLFPLRTLIEIPGCLPTADAFGRVVADDNHSYIVKGNKGGQYVMASEWTATHMAEAINIPCPTPKVIQLNNGDLLFGSRVIGGIADAAITTELLTSITSEIR
jgi:hypothetical protein